MKNRNLIRRFEMALNICDKLVSDLDDNVMSGTPFTHPQARRLEEVQQHLSDLKTNIDRLFEESK